MSAREQHNDNGAVRNPYLVGNYAPIHTELSSVALEVVGELPAAMDGTFLRIGPNPQFEPLGRYHWFDGDGMLHAIEIQNGRAHYTNRWVRTAGFEREREEGRALWTGLIEPPAMDNPDGPFKNVANTATVFHDGRLLCLWEAGAPHQVKLPSLQTVGPHDFNGRVQHAFTAHPKVDPSTGELITFGYGFVPPYVQYAVVDRAGNVTHQTEIDLLCGVMMHDFAITERYSVIMDLPVTFRFERIEQGLPPLGFEKELPSRFGVMPRHGAGSEIRWFEGPSCMVFHTVNAYEDGDDVVLLACRMESTDVLGATAASDSDRGGNNLHRWRFNMKTGTMREDRLDDTSADFPRINDARIGRAHRYAYAGRLAMQGRDAATIDGLVKYDLRNNGTQTHVHGPHRFGGEGVFVPNPKGTDEDAGWVLTLVHDERENQSELVVIDAQDFARAPIARVRIPQRVPYGFHAGWVSRDAMQSQR